MAAPADDLVVTDDERAAEDDDDELVAEKEILNEHVPDVRSCCAGVSPATHSRSQG